jgi:GTPase Era involved in 16S rRNA processing
MTLEQINDDFERPSINIGIIGEISAGKSTLMNSMFVKTFSDMKRIRTTMSVNIYCETEDKTKIADAKKILAENKSFEENKKALLDKIEEKVYYVDKIVSFGERKKNILYNIIDIPGLNDGEGNDTIKKWLDNNIDLFDIILFIINGEYAMNTQSERTLFQYVVDSISKNPHIKLINIINKYDDPI